MKYLGENSISSFIYFSLKIGNIILKVLTGLSIIGLLTLILLPRLFADANTEGITLITTGLKIQFTAPVVHINWHTQLLYSLGIIMLPRYVESLLVVSLLKKIFKSLVNKKAFSLENSNLIKYIGLVIIVGEILISFLVSLLGSFWAGHISVSGINIKPSGFVIPYYSIFTGLVFIVLGEIFRIGANLQDEHDMTV